MDKIELTVQQLLGMVQAMGELLQVDLPMQAAFQLRRIARAAQVELDIFNVVSANLRKKYTLDGKIEPSPELDAESDALMNTLVVLPVAPLTAASLGEELTVKTRVLLALDKIIVD